MRPGIVPTLYRIAACLLLAGLGARLGARQLWKPDLDPLPVHRQGFSGTGPRVPPTTTAMAPGLAEAVAAANIFSPLRSTPTARYTPDSTTGISVRPPEPPAPPPRRTIQLFGIGMTEGLATALLDADPLVPGAEIYHAGDALPRGGRVVTIARDHVVIETPEGRERLRMVQPPRRAPSSPTPPEPQ